MKNTILILLSILTSFFSIAQNPNQVYRKADSLYTAKDFKSAAFAYNEGIKIQGATAGFNRYISAAASWSMANSPDSAFSVLDMLAKNPKLTQSDYKNIESAKELAALQSDKRWKQLLAASSIKTQRFRIPTLSTIHVLEPLNCRKSNWNLSIAGSALLKETAGQRS